MIFLKVSIEPLCYVVTHFIPCRATGMASFCILEGAFQPTAAHASHNTSTTPWKQMEIQVDEIHHLIEIQK